MKRQHKGSNRLCGDSLENGRNFFASYLSDKRLIPRTYKELNKKQTLIEKKNPINTWANELNRHFKRMKYEWPISAQETFLFRYRGNVNKDDIKIPFYPSLDVCHPNNNSNKTLRSVHLDLEQRWTLPWTLAAGGGGCQWVQLVKSGLCHKQLCHSYV